MEYDLQCSKEKLCEVVNTRLKKLKKTSSVEDLRQANEFLNETKLIAEAIQFIGSLETTIPEDFYYETEQFSDDSGHTTVVDIIAEACELMIAMYSVIDYNKIDEGNLQWIPEDVSNFLQDTRECFGTRIPQMPNLIGLHSD